MTTDITRSTFQPSKHYSGVLQQQGRVQLDADWNEQIAIEAHRDQTMTRDVVGSCGAPMENAGFGMIDVADLSADEQARLTDLGILPLANGDFLIDHGRFYVDGILCENEETISVVHQPDLLDGPPIDAAGRYLIYLDVWQRHITALEDPSIREVALGGPDTTTRLKTVSQVKAMPVVDEGDGTHCLSTFSDWTGLVTPTSASLNARGAPESVETGPCIVPPGAGFRRLENQLYRVEIHRGGDIGEATFKWSRINASTVSAWLGQSGTDQERLQISNTGPDDLLGFAGGRSVELTDDARELRNQPGTLVALTRVDEDILTINPASRLHPAEDSIDRADFPHHPKIRRWDSPSELPVEVPAENSGWISLEDGVEIRFEAGPYESGQFWLIPARTLTGDVEWPRDNGDPVPQPPHGIEHHYCRLALIDAVETEAGLQLTPVDCRPIFPPLTLMTSFFYLNGDGQEAMPDPTAPGALLPLAAPLQVGVANGQEPVSGATVRFTVTEGHGRVQGSTGPIDVTTGADGVAVCAWELDSGTQSQ
ncbi:MAG TPA: DUF6519 domain-containing protein, partial [Nitrolancea sp.]|nr:DUF6519 domain-containing protein [Nitrolancea sp.]